MRLFKTIACFFCTIALYMPTQILAQTKELKNQELLEKSGFVHCVKAVPSALQAGADQIRQQGIAVDEKFLKAWRDVVPVAFQSERILKIVDEGIEKQLTGEDKAQLLAHFNTPFGKKITDLENGALDPAARREIEALERNPAAYADRAALYTDLADILGGPTAAVDRVMDIALAVQVGLLTAAEGPKVDVDALKAQLEKERPAVTAQMANRTMAAFAYTYRSLSEDEIRAYLAVLRSTAMQKFYRALIALQSEAMTAQSKEFGQLLFKALQTGQPI